MKEKILAQLKSKYNDLGLSAETLDRVADFLTISIAEESQIEPVVANAHTLNMLKGFESEIGRRVSKFKKQAEDLEAEIQVLKKGGGNKTLAQLQAEVEELKKKDPNDAKIADLEKMILELKSPKVLTREEIAALVAEQSSEQINILKQEMEDIKNKDKRDRIRAKVWAKFIKDDLKNTSLEQTYKSIIFDKMPDSDDEDEMYEDLKKQANDLDVSLSKSGFVPEDSSHYAGAGGRDIKDFAKKQRERRYGKK